jgi:hypothetical protein
MCTPDGSQNLVAVMSAITVVAEARAEPSWPHRDREAAVSTLAGNVTTAGWPGGLLISSHKIHLR